MGPVGRGRTAWLVSSLAIAWPVVARTRGGLASAPGGDLLMYLGGAQHARVGESPYQTPGYVYSPVLSLILSPMADQSWIGSAWVLASVGAGIAAALLVMGDAFGGLAGWRPAVGWALAMTTLFWSAAITLELFLGQVQLFLLLVVALAGVTFLRRPLVAGASLACAAAIKTWPLALVMFSVTPHRTTTRRDLTRTLLGLGLVGTICGAWSVAVLGPTIIPEWARASATGSQQPFQIYGVWGLARLTPNPLGTALGVASALWVVALMALAWTRGADPRIRFWNGVLGTVLLLPVVHAFYLLVALPALWLRTAMVLKHGPSRRLVLATTALFVSWWFMVHVDVAAAGWRPAAALGTTLLALTVSVLTDLRARPAT